MPAKPATLPRFADGSTAVVTVPTEGEKDTGWVAGAPAPAGRFNWLFLWIYRWIEYLNDTATLAADIAVDLAARAFTWTAAHTFSGAVTFSGTVVRELHTVGNPGEPAFGNSWAHDVRKTTFWMDANGDICLEGSASAPDNTVNREGIMFTLPNAFRPMNGEVSVPCIINNVHIGRLDITTVGDVSVAKMPGVTDPGNVWKVRFFVRWNKNVPAV